jgi:hypothetical protein
LERHRERPLIKFASIQLEFALSHTIITEGGWVSFSLSLPLTGISIMCRNRIWLLARRMTQKCGRELCFQIYTMPPDANPRRRFYYCPGCARASIIPPSWELRASSGRNFRVLITIFQRQVFILANAHFKWPGRLVGLKREVACDFAREASDWCRFCLPASPICHKNHPRGVIFHLLRLCVCVARR